MKNFLIIILVVLTSNCGTQLPEEDSGLRRIEQINNQEKISLSELN